MQSNPPSLDSRLTLHTVRFELPSWTHYGTAFRPWLFQTRSVHFQVSIYNYLYFPSCLKLVHGSSAILVVATILTAECKEYWQLLLCQGILTGVACGMIFGPIPAVSSQWFLKRRALAFGVISFGASIGGTIIPIAARRLIDLVGYVNLSCSQSPSLTSF